MKGHTPPLRRHGNKGLFTTTNTVVRRRSFLRRRWAGRRTGRHLSSVFFLSKKNCWKTCFPAIFSIFPDFFSSFFQHFCGDFFPAVFFQQFFAAKIAKNRFQQFPPKISLKNCWKTLFLPIFRGFPAIFDVFPTKKNQHFFPAIFAVKRRIFFKHFFPAIFQKLKISSNFPKPLKKH